MKEKNKHSSRKEKKGMELKRKQGETENQYIWRIGQMIDAGQIQNWALIVDTLNQELRNDETEYRDESAYRKKYQYAKMFYDEIFCRYGEEDYLKELEEKQRMIKKERQKLNIIKNQYHKDIRNQSRIELFYETLKDGFQKMEIPKYELLKGEESNMEYILTISDIHCGAKFESENNSYSLEECSVRFQVLLEEVICFITKNELSHFNVLELGDTIQNLLRLSDLKLNEASVVDSIVYVSKLLSNFLNELSKYCNIDYYHCPTANHSQLRLLGTKADELSFEDVEYIIANYISDTLKENERVNVHTNFGKEYIELEINDFNIIAMHGHKIKNINSSLMDLSNFKKTFYDILFLGHYHASSENTTGETGSSDTEVIIAPSFVGSDPYSDSLFKGAKASCGIYGIDKYRGHIETYKIILN